MSLGTDLRRGAHSRPSGTYQSQCEHLTASSDCSPQPLPLRAEGAPVLRAWPGFASCLNGAERSCREGRAGIPALFSVLHWAEVKLPSPDPLPLRPVPHVLASSFSSQAETKHNTKGGPLPWAFSRIALLFEEPEGAAPQAVESNGLLAHGSQCRPPTAPASGVARSGPGQTTRTSSFPLVNYP